MWLKYFYESNVKVKLIKIMFRIKYNTVYSFIKLKDNFELKIWCLSEFNK